MSTQLFRVPSDVLGGTGTRARYTIDENVGLTTTCNRLKDPAREDARIRELRVLHAEMDRAVLEAYAKADPERSWF